MTAYFDTSGLLRAWRLGLVPVGKTRSHAIAEFYCVLTGTGLKSQRAGKTISMTLSPKDGAAAVAETFARLDFLDLTPGQALAAVNAAVAENIQGRLIHDWMHVRAAELAKVERIVTLNAADFAPLTSLRVVNPSEHFAAQA